MHHRAIYSASSSHGPADDLQAAWAPLYDAHHVDLVLNGHDHDYERTWPIRAGQVCPSTAVGTVYIVAGAAGASLYNHGLAYWTAVSESAQHVIVLTARREGTKKYSPPRGVTKRGSSGRRRRTGSAGIVNVLLPGPAMGSVSW